MTTSIPECLAVAQGLLTPLIALLALYIAFQQYIIGKRRLRLDLYDRRFAVFRALMDLHVRVFEAGAVNLQEIRVFMAKTNEASFLFDDEIPAYLGQVYQRAVDLMALNRKLESTGLPTGEERTRASQESSALCAWFADELKSAKERFLPYLGFKGLRE